MKPLDQILIEYFGATAPVFEDSPDNTGDLTSQNIDPFMKLTELLWDLETLGLSLDANLLQRQIKEIILSDGD